MIVRVDKSRFIGPSTGLKDGATNTTSLVNLASRQINLVPYGIRSRSSDFFSELLEKFSILSQARISNQDIS